jgi:hypothetical protein
MLQEKLLSKCYKIGAEFLFLISRPNPSIFPAVIVITVLISRYDLSYD